MATTKEIEVSQQIAEIIPGAVSTHKRGHYMIYLVIFNVLEILFI